MITYTWSIVTTDFSLDAAGAPDRITTAHWRCEGTENEASAGAYGTQSVDLPASSTEAEVLAAVQAEIQTDVEAGIANQLGLQANPTSGSGRVWEFPAGTVVWKSATAYAVDDVALYGDVPYTCIQAHTSQAGWMPPAVPALWSIQNQGGGGPVEWVAGELVAVGDERTYLGTTYAVIQGHTTQAGWEPPNVPALWSAV